VGDFAVLAKFPLFLEIGNLKRIFTDYQKNFQTPIDKSKYICNNQPRALQSEMACFVVKYEIPKG